MPDQNECIEVHLFSVHFAAPSALTSNTSRYYATPLPSFGSLDAVLEADPDRPMGGVLRADYLGPALILRAARYSSESDS